MNKRLIQLVLAIGTILLAFEARAQFYCPTAAGQCIPGCPYRDDLDSDLDDLWDWQEDVDNDCVLDDNETDRNNKDTDGDGIRDNYEQNQAGPEDNCVTSWDCDGDGLNNGNDPDSDEDGIPDNEENCSFVPTAAHPYNDGNILAALGFSKNCVNIAKFATNPYHWEETNPYNADSDGDTFSDLNDLCPRDNRGGLQGIAGTGGKKGKGTLGFACAKFLCRAAGNEGATMAALTANNPGFSVDADNKPDIKEDLNGDCALLKPEDDPASLESDPYKTNTDGDAKSDFSDECPQDSDLDCKGVCQPTGDPATGAINAATGQPVNRNTFDTDDDNINDGKEDMDGDCEYDAPGEGQFSSVETDWRNSDTDGDAHLFRQGALGVGNDRVDDCPHLNPEAIPEGADAETVRRFTYPGCLLYYCCSPADGESCSYGEHTFRIVAGGHTDDDGLDDDVEDPDANCLAGSHPLETDPLSPDTDGDGVNDDVDPCPHRADETYCPEICPLSGESSPLWRIWERLDSDNDGLKNAQEDRNSNCQPDLFETDPFLPDTDDDGVDDFYDACYPGNTMWQGLDTDGDGLKNGAEDVDGDCERDPFESDPFVEDTDDDGIDDFSDACPYSSSATCLQRCSSSAYQSGAAELDSDGDGLKNGEEDSNKNCIFFGEFGNDGETLEPYDSNPYLRDSDGDGIGDRVDGCNDAVSPILADVNVPVTGEEMDCARSQCLEAGGRFPGVLKDSDRDGLPDIKEDIDTDCIVSVDPNGEVAETDRFNPDTDGDGILDGVEDKNRDGDVDTNETNPRVVDTDSDGIVDGKEDANHNGRVDFGELDPKSNDTDKDGIVDNLEDRNLDGAWQGGQLRVTGPCRAFDEEGKPVVITDADGAPAQLETSGYLPDSDLDGIPDDKEDKNKNGIYTDVAKLFGILFSESPAEEGVEPSAENVGEFGETHPCDADTDHDGLLDGQEDRNMNGLLDIQEGETSPISPNTYGEPDISRFERRLGISGCSLIP